MIYLDNAATARPDIGAAESAMRYLKEDFFNPSSMVREGFEIHKEMDKARASLLSHVARSETHELVFTSCGSESDNQALFSAGRRGNVVITEGEHAAVFAAAAELARRGIEVRRARLNGNGSVDVNDLLKKVDRKTSLVSVIHVNNETGAVNDIDEISRAVKEINAAAVFHSDGVQAFGKLLYPFGRKYRSVFRERAQDRRRARHRRADTQKEVRAASLYFRWGAGKGAAKRHGKYLRHRAVRFGGRREIRAFARKLQACRRTFLLCKKQSGQADF